VALGAALALLACRGEEAPRPAAGTAPAPQATAAGARAPGRDAELPPGRAEVRREADGSLRVRARAAPRLAVLQKLTRAAGFAITPGLGHPPPRSLDLDLAGVSVEQALDAVLGDVPHHLHYEVAGDEAVLRRVTIGMLRTSGAAAAPGSEAELGAREEKPRLGAPSWADRRAGSQRDEESRRAAIEDGRDSRDETERAAAAALMRPEEDLPQLLEYLASDPSAAVRANAAGALADVDGGENAFRAADALLAALRDSDPAVVAAAVGALEDLYDVLPDPRLRTGVAALENHTDPRVRAAVATFREWTEDAQ
jgi:hypothetical protein